MINRTKLAWRHQIQLVQIKMQRYRRLQQQQAVQRYSLWRTLEYKIGIPIAQLADIAQLAQIAS